MLNVAVLTLPLRFASHRLTYWVVFAAFSILEAFLSVLLRWIPFYFALKLAFLAWCFMPQTQVAFVCGRERENSGENSEKNTHNTCCCCMNHILFHASGRFFDCEPFGRVHIGRHAASSSIMLLYGLLEGAYTHVRPYRRRPPTYRAVSGLSL